VGLVLPGDGGASPHGPRTLGPAPGTAAEAPGPPEAPPSDCGITDWARSRRVLEVDPGRSAGLVRAVRPLRLPVVLTWPEVRAVLLRLERFPNRGGDLWKRHSDVAGRISLVARTAR
jgi:hypothetical protein